MISVAAGLQRAPRVLLAWLALPVIVGVITVAWLLFETCENSRLRELPSPDGRWKLVVFERSCSGTVAWTTHVSVVGEAEILSGAPGNLLVSFDRHGSLIGTSVREPEIHARWRNADTIELSYSSAVPIQASVSELGRFRVLHTRTP